MKILAKRLFEFCCSLLQFTVSRSLLLTFALLAPAASAYQLTYESQALTFQSGTINFHQDLFLDSPPSPRFSIQFNLSDNMDGRPLSSTVTTFDDYHIASFAAIPSEDSHITFNEDGDIASWMFSVMFTLSNPAIGYEPPQHTTWSISSYHGIDTCNCDFYVTENQLYYQRQNSWALAAEVSLLFSGNNNVNNWVLNSVRVDEPPLPFLLLSSLALIGVARLRHRKCYF
jgi:hypothetical protein